MDSRSGLRHAAIGKSIPAIPKPPRPWWTAGQMIWLGSRSFALLVVLGLLLLVRFDLTSLLFTTALGKKLLLEAAALVLIGTGVELVFFFGLNYALPPEDAGRHARRRLWTILGSGVLTLFFFVPGLFTLWVGPAAVRIVEVLEQEQP